MLSKVNKDVDNNVDVNNNVDDDVNNNIDDQKKFDKFFFVQIFFQTKFVLNKISFWTNFYPNQICFELNLFFNQNFLNRGGCPPKNPSCLWSNKHYVN